jgi:5-methylcytosine-specific restriction endonuclease McrA
MAYPRLRARFFVTPNGECLPKAPPLTESERYNFWPGDHTKCAVCDTGLFRWASQRREPWNRDGEVGHVDHILPRSRGGQNNRNNLQLICAGCNCSKGALG